MTANTPIAGLLAASVASVLVALALAVAAHAQTCSADSQCPGAGMTQSGCAGNTSVTTRYVCAGRCQAVEIARVPCAGACSGGVCIPLAPSAPSLRPVPLTPTCPTECACRQGQLTVSTGLRDVDGICTTRTRRCRRGCYCDPAPRCQP
jgi:hypothetical protein